MREFRSHGSVRGALSNGRPYRDHGRRFDNLELWWWGPCARVAHCLDHLPDRRDHQLRLVLVDVVPALGGDGVVRIWDELGEILLQR